MSSNVDRSTLGYLGSDFQLKLVKCFFEDQKYFTSIQDIVDQNMFSNEHLRRIVGFMKDRYNFNETVTTYFEMETIVRSKVSDAIALEQLLAYIEKIKEMDLAGMDIVEEESEKFFKQQNLTKAINKAQEIIKNGDFSNYYTIEDVVKKALETNSKQDFGFRLFDNIDKDLDEKARAALPTGVEKLDKALYGGLAKGELGVIVAPPGIGKAQPLTSRILTPHGYKLMGDIKIGDFVIGGDGRSHEVIGVYPQGVRPVYKVDFSNGTSCECDIEHLWNVNSYKQRRRKSYVRGSGRKNVKYEFKPDNTFKTLSLREIIEQGIVKHFNGISKDRFVFKVPVVKPIEFSHKEVPLDPYFVGYYIGDGCYQRRCITVGIQDKDFISNEMTHILGEDLHEHFYEYKNCWAFNIVGDTDKKCKEMFGNCTSRFKEIPENYLWNSKEVRISVLQGLMDSDGTTSAKGITEFVTKSEKLAKQVQFLVRSLGGYATIKSKNATYFSKKYNKRIECGVVYRLTISLVDKSIPLYRLERKQKRVRYRDKYNEQIYITGVKYVRDDYTQCIFVDSDEHLYVTEDFIVTHNTSATTGFAANAAITKAEENNFNGYKVLHFFFEDEEVNIRRKYYGFVTDIDACELSLPGVRPIAIQRLNEDTDIKRMLKENVICERLSTGEIRASEIKNKIRQYIARGFKPDLIIIDYFECLKFEKSDVGDSEWSKEGVTMRKLESMAKEFNVALWVPVQGTRDSIGAEIVGMMQAGGSVKKTQIAHVVITFGQTDEMKTQGKINVFLGKFRAGRIDKNKFMNVYLNNGTCKFDMSETDDGTDLPFEERQTNRLNEIARQTKQTYNK